MVFCAVSVLSDHKAYPSQLVALEGGGQAYDQIRPAGAEPYLMNVLEVHVSISSGLMEMRGGIGVGLGQGGWHGHPTKSTSSGYWLERGS